MKYFSAIIAILSAYYPLSTRAEELKVVHPVVLELFTSQGCSSCPPADMLASKYAEDPNILVLSYHVHYWDYLGWKDPFSSTDNTNRQHEYAQYLGSKGVYTPQAIIQGTYDIVGSDARGLQNAFIKTANSGKHWITPTLSSRDGTLLINLPAQENIRANIVIVGYQKHSSNAVTRGENSGDKLSHRNSVTTILPLGEWHGEAINITKSTPQGDGLAVLIQSSDKGEIIGAAWL